MTVEGLRTTINKQFVQIFVFCVRILYRFLCSVYGFCMDLYVRIYTDFHFSEKRIFKKTIWQHCCHIHDGCESKRTNVRRCRIRAAFKLCVLVWTHLKGSWEHHHATREDAMKSPPNQIMETPVSKNGVEVWQNS